MKIIHRVTAQLSDSISIAKKFQPLWSGILVFDGKVIRVFDDATRRFDRKRLSEDEIRWMHKMRWLCGVDYGTGDLPHYALADSENMVDLVIYFRTLKEMGYKLIALVCDGNSLIPRAAKFVFGKQLIVQRCTRHFLEDLRRFLPTEEDRKEERTRLEQLILRIKYVIEADTIDEAIKHLDILKQYTEKNKSQLARKMIRLFQKTKIELTAHLLYPELKLPHTSNDIENLFKQLMQRLKTIGRFFHQTYAKNYLNAWALLRRFTPFTDCRKGRRHRNKKSPLELAGCEVQNIDPLKLVR
jgi:transposase-like protein